MNFIDQWSFVRIFTYDCAQQDFQQSFDQVDNLEALKISVSNMIY